MATPAFHAVSSSAETNNDGGLTITRPASTLSGYFAVAFMYMEDNSAGVAVTHTGWTALTGGFDTASNPDMRLVAAYRVCDGTSADDFTPTWTGTIYSGGGIIVLKPSAAGTLSLDAEGTATADNASPHTGTCTTVATETMLVAGIVNFQELALTPGSTGGTPTEAVDTPGTWIAYRAESSAGSKTIDASSAGGTAVVVKLVSVKETGGSSAPTVVGAGTAAFTATNGATLAPGLPTGWAADDVHVLLAARSDNTAMTSLSPTWINISAANNTAAQRVEVWVRRAVAGDAAPTVTFGSGTVVRGARIIGLRGVDPALDLSTLQISRSDNAASATITFATLTPTPADTRLLALYAYEDDPSAASQITDWSTFTVSTSALGNDMALGYADRIWPNASTATGALTSTASGGTFANSVNVGILIDFPSASTGGASGTAAVTIGKPALAATGVFATTGTAAVGIGAPSLAATGTFIGPPISGDVAVSITAPSLSATGIFATTGTAAVSIGPSSISATGAFATTGTADITIGPPALAVTGAFATTGTAAITLGPPVLDVTGLYTPPPVTGTADITIGPPALAVTGAFATTGTAAVAIGPPALVVMGAFATTGTAAISIGPPALESIGTVADPGSGVVVVTIGPPVVASTGAFETVGTATVAIGPPILAATGIFETTGTAAIAVGPPAISALGISTPLEISGSGAVVIGPPLLTATGAFALTGEAAVTIGPPALAATGATDILEITGTVAVMVGGGTGTGGRARYSRLSLGL